MAPVITGTHGDHLREATVAPMINSSEKIKVQYNNNNINNISEHSAPEGSKCEDKIPDYLDWKPQIIWTNTFFITLFHILAVYAFVTRWNYVYPQTYIWGLFVGGVGGFGVTGGVHRLWTHRSYKAKWTLRVILALCYSVAGQNTIFDWVRDHRVHHKYSETAADPHNSNRGFFFAHVGWLMMKKHPEVIRRGKQLDMSDIINDPVVTFHQKHFRLLKIIFCFTLPIIVPYLVWGEDLYDSIMGIGIIRYVLGLNFTWLVNSAAHLWGNKPYDRRINPAENRAVALLAMGEGWHNYHHVFPWDYKAAELGDYTFNFTTMMLDLFAKIGWAYDLKYPSDQLVRRVVEKHGDGSHSVWGTHMAEVPEEEDPNIGIKNPSKIYNGENIITNKSYWKIGQIKERNSKEYTVNEISACIYETCRQS